MGNFPEACSVVKKNVTMTTYKLVRGDLSYRNSTCSFIITVARASALVFFSVKRLIGGNASLLALKVHQKPQ